MMAVYNTSRFIDGLLKSHENSPPSFTVRLYREHWTLNNGSKFLYNNQIASLLDDIRTRHIPVDFLELFDQAKLPFYEGCLIVELLDYRPTKSSDPELEQPEKTRLVLTPNDESRWTDICLMSQKSATPWSDADALELEAQLLLTTAPPLCLEPDVHLTRIVNATQRATTPPAPPSLKRKASALDQEADDIEKARRLKIIQFMNPRLRSTAPSYVQLFPAACLDSNTDAYPLQIWLSGLVTGGQARE
ncbi:Spt20 family-domain-containing protein [Cubamyces lactineus]|nr:Spt20 family-domain-containing protein [Cubamyces lactineus]